MNPSHSPGASSPGPPHRHKGTSKPLAVPLGKVAVAIVEDDERFRLYLQETLEQARKFHCVGSYSSGEEALIGIPQSGAQVVVMDVKMPGVVCRRGHATLATVRYRREDRARHPGGRQRGKVSPRGTPQTYLRYR